MFDRLRQRRGTLAAALFCLYCLTLHESLPVVVAPWRTTTAWFSSYLGFTLVLLILAEGLALFNLLPGIYAARSEDMLGTAWFRRGIMLPLTHLIVNVIVAKLAANLIAARIVGSLHEILSWLFVGLVILKEIWLWSYMLIREADEPDNLKRQKEKFGDELTPALALLFDAILFVNAALLFTFAWQPYIFAESILDYRGSRLEPGIWRSIEITLGFLVYYVSAFLLFVLSDWHSRRPPWRGLWLWAGIAVATFGGTFRLYNWPPMPNKSQINAIDSAGKRPVVQFARYASSKRFEALMKLSPDVNAANADGKTALMAAIESRRYAVFESLLKTGADVNARDAQGKTPLHLLVDCFEGSTQFIEALRGKHVDFDAQDNEGKTPAMWAMRRPCGDTPDLLLHGIDEPDLRDMSGRTLLMVASDYKRRDFVKRMAQKGACINCQDQLGNTALHIALTERKTDISLVELLVSLGANPRIRNAYGQTCIDLAPAKDKPRVRKIMLAAKGPFRR